MSDNMIGVGFLLWLLGTVGIFGYMANTGADPNLWWFLVGSFWPLAIPLIGVIWIVSTIVQISLGFYDWVIHWRQTDRHKTPENDEHCCHEFFKCQVPTGDSCVAIYHKVCRKCRWDETKGIVMPLDIWRSWALPQLEKLDFKWDTTKAGSMSLDWREWTTPPIERLDNQ